MLKKESWLASDPGINKSVHRCFLGSDVSARNICGRILEVALVTKF